MQISNKSRKFAQGENRKTMSPSFLKEKGYTFKIYSNEEERMHIHVLKDGHEAKFWLEPHVELANFSGFQKHEINRIQSIVEVYAEYFKQQYRHHISGRVND